MSNLPAFSRRAQRALEVLADGGCFMNRLERGYGGREQFHVRLCASSAWRSVVPGIGHAAFHELQNAGFLKRDFAASSSVSEVYKLNKEA